MATRRLEALAVPQGQAVLGILPTLRAALHGTGPALLPHAAGATPSPALAPGDALRPEEDDPADPTVAVIATSGSTGIPKGAVLPASALLASASAAHDRLGGPGRWLLALPADHIAGLQVLVRSLVARTEPVVVDLTDGFDPAAFALAARGLAQRSPFVRRYTSLVPTQVRRLLDAEDDARAALTLFDAVLVGGAAAADALLARARAAGVRVVTTYGMSETCGGCVYDGRPLDGVLVRTDDRTDGGPSDGGRAGAGPSDGAPDGGGRVLLGGPMIARGYRGGDAAGAFDLSGATRWFRTDDAGTIADDGTLTVLGRLDDVIVTGGLKISPAVVEQALATMPQIAEAVVVGVPDEQWGECVVAVIVAAPGHPVPDLDEVRRGVSGMLGPGAAPRRLLVLDRLPLRGPGKPDRRLLRSLAAADREAHTDRRGHGDRRPAAPAR